MKTHKARLGENGRLSAKQITDLIKAKKEEFPALQALEDYRKGDNPGIKKKEKAEGQNKIPVPYGRLLTTIVTGFMYKSGLITYSQAEGVHNDPYMEALGEVLKANEEPELNTELGKDQTVYGEAYELHYIGNDEGQDQFARISVFDMVPVYSYDIKPELVASIRFWEETDDESSKKVTYVEVYYSDVIQYYRLDGTTLKPHKEEVVHYYGDVPVVVFRNNPERQGDLTSVAKLLDAYDVLLSTFLDDEEKFAEAILLLHGKTMDSETVAKLKKARVIDGLKQGEGAEYLTKDVTLSGRQELLEIVKQEIHRQSLIPDMTDPNTLGQKSGEAFIYLFALFELLAGDKQTYFTQGLRKRLELITTTLSVPKGDTVGSVRDIKIHFSRNLPKNLTMIADIVTKLNGVISQKTLLSLLPFVENPELELEQKREEENLEFDVEDIKLPTEENAGA